MKASPLNGWVISCELVHVTHIQNPLGFVCRRRGEAIVRNPPAFPLQRELFPAEALNSRERVEQFVQHPPGGRESLMVVWSQSVIAYEPRPRNQCQRPGSHAHY